MTLLKVVCDYFREGKTVIEKPDLYGKSGTVSNGRIVIEEGLEEKERYITIIHEFLHIDCRMDKPRCPDIHRREYGGRCRFEYLEQHPTHFRLVGKCFFEKQIEQEAVKIYEENGIVMKYLRWKVDGIVPETILRGRDRRKGQLFLFE